MIYLPLKIGGGSGGGGREERNSDGTTPYNWKDLEWVRG